MIDIMIFALVCGADLSPADCTPKTARDAYPLGVATNEMSCPREAQMRDGEATITLGPGEFKKYVCKRQR